MIHSFLLMGQSNMAGRGRLNEAKEIDKSHIRIMRNGRWQPMFRPINPDRSFSGVNLAESFAEKYAEKYGVDVGLIPCADGGTTLEQWKEGSILFENAVNLARLAQRTSRIVGILWHQGESDCPDDRYPLYREKFEAMLSAFRRETGLSDVPVIVGALGDFLPDCTSQPCGNYHHINEFLRQIADADPLVGLATAEGLGHNGDNLHFNAEALYEFGLRYFAEYERIGAPADKSDGELEDDSKRSSMEAL